MEPMPEKPPVTLGHKVKRAAYIGWLLVEYGFNKIADRSEDYVAVLRREAELFLGVGLVIVGLMNFENGKNCDGNTTDYLSCTRPSTFYYFSWWEILLVLLGAFLIAFWLFGRSEKKR